jgi:hypothetical protein
VSSGTFAAGDLAFILPLHVQVLGNQSEFGADDLPCTLDDTPAGTPLRITMAVGTGTTAGEIFDAGNENGKRIGSGEMCGSNVCLTEIDGAAVSCTDLAMTNLDGLVLGGAFTHLESSAGDVVTTIRLEALP